ncbi:MAG: hypothetical protein JXN64_12380 [Spirochaetes bacterium]|nr:hypothetical protein [Spirochaetota bacterium]
MDSINMKYIILGIVFVLFLLIKRTMNQKIREAQEKLEQEALNKKAPETYEDIKNTGQYDDQIDRDMEMEYSYPEEVDLPEYAGRDIKLVKEELRQDFTEEEDDSEDSQNGIDNNFDDAKMHTEYAYRQEPAFKEYIERDSQWREEEPKREFREEKYSDDTEKEIHNNIKIILPDKKKSEAKQKTITKNGITPGKMQARNKLNPGIEDLRNAIIWSEILAPPLSERDN